MARPKQQERHEQVSKRTKQGGKKPRLSTMNKSQRRNFKKDRGQGS